MATIWDIVKKNTRAIRFWGYFENEQYQRSLGQKGIFYKTEELYNPIPNTITNMTAFIVGEGLKVAGNQEELLNDIWQHNKMDIKMADLILPWLLGTQRCVIEILSRDPYPRVSIHNWDDVEIKTSEDEVIYAKIDGYIEQFKPELDEFIEVQITKEFWNVEGKRYIQETIDEVPQMPIPLPGSPSNPQIPVVLIETNYNIEPMFNLIDNWNEKQAYIDNINWEHGDPLLQGSGFQEIPKTREELTEKEATAARTIAGQKVGRHGKRIATYTGQGKYDYVEMQSHMEKSMLDDQEKIVKIVEKEFPESNLELLFNNTSQLAFETLQLKFKGFEAKLNPVKNNLKAGLAKMNDLILLMQGITNNENEIIYPEIFSKSVSLVLDELSKAVGLGILTEEYILENNMIPQLIRNPKEALKMLQAINKEKESSKNLFEDE